MPCKSAAPKIGAKIVVKEKAEPLDEYGQALNILKHESELLGITNPTLHSAVEVGIESIERITWHQAISPDLPSDQQIVLGKTGSDLWIYRYRLGLGFFRLRDGIENEEESATPVAFWRVL